MSRYPLGYFRLDNVDGKVILIALADEWKAPEQGIKAEMTPGKTVRFGLCGKGEDKHHVVSITLTEAGAEAGAEDESK